VVASDEFIVAIDATQDVSHDAGVVRVGISPRPPEVSKINHWCWVNQADRRRKNNPDQSCVHLFHIKQQIPSKVASAEVLTQTLEPEVWVKCSLVRFASFHSRPVDSVEHGECRLLPGD
jgi:hypothetical protein